MGYMTIVGRSGWQVARTSPGLWPPSPTRGGTRRALCCRARACAVERHRGDVCLIAARRSLMQFSKIVRTRQSGWRLKSRLNVHAALRHEVRLRGLPRTRTRPRPASLPLWAGLCNPRRRVSWPEAVQARFQPPALLAHSCPSYFGKLHKTTAIPGVNAPPGMARVGMVAVSCFRY